MSSAWGQFTPAQPPAGKLAGRTRTNPQPIIDPFAALIQPSEEATTLLRRAAEGIDRKDWKLAIDSLQRIVELPGEHVLTSDGRLYESARRHAHRQIASLPAEGLAAYRLVHDGEAVALLKQGLQDHNSELLATVVDRFLCTTPGDEAAFTLADWLIDEGRFAEASGILQSTFGTTGRGGIFPDSHLPTWAVPSRLAICAASLGQKQRAAALLKVASSQPASAAASEPADRHIARWSQRKVAVETCVNQATASESLQRSDWICAMGNPARDARQPEVSPTLRDHEPGMFKLSGEPKFPDAVDDYARNNHLLPVRQLVTNGEVLLLRREDDLLALDIDSFSPRWQTRARREEASAAAEGTDFQGFGQAADNNRQSIEAQLRSDPAVIKGLHDWVGGSVSLARGMALAVEWVGDPPALLPPNIPRRFAPAMVGQSPITHPNRLVAYSLKDGAFLWKSDASETKQVSINGTGPAETEFLAPPIYVEPNPAASASNASSARGRDGYLVAPCRMNGDLFAALLEPSTGKMVRQIYLCGTGAGAFDSLETREPCLADGVIYFATGRGLLIAVTTSDWSVRWAVRYPGLPENMVTGGWLPMPPVAVSDVVLLAPSDSDLLLCFDRSSGALRWQSPRGTSTQLVAANESNVWVAGKGVSMLDLESGKPVWNRGTSDISGRVSLSGDRLYVPTFESLVALEARSGEPIMLDDAAEAPGLGNLLAWEGSLYSVGAFKVKKYPDLGKGYEQALARHKEKPADPSRALRLAALELLRHKPARAIDALRGLPDNLKDTNPGQFQTVTHLRVQAMLDSVRQEEVKGEAALKLLTDARRMAATPEDALNSSLALGEYLSRSNQPLDAALQYLSLVTSLEGDLEVLTDGDQIIKAESSTGLQRRARGIAVQRIADAAKDLSPEQSQQLSGRVEAFMAQATSKHDATSLIWLAESDGLGEPAHRAEILLGAWAMSELRFEPAESYFLRALRGSKDPTLLAEAAARLVILYLEPEDLHQPVSADRWLRKLETDWAQVKIPSSVLSEQTSEAKAVSKTDGAATLTGGQIAALLRSGNRLDAKVLKAHLAAMAPVVLSQPGPPPFRMQPGARPLTFRGERTEPLSDKSMLLMEGNKVEAHSADDGKILWPAELRVISDLAVEPRALETQLNQASLRSDSLGRARGVLSGQMMIVNTEYGIHAIGLLTALRLWSRPFIPPESAGGVTGSDACIWSHEGYIISIDGRGRLEVDYATQGDRFLWRAIRTDRHWAAVRARGPYVVAVNGSLEQADVYRLANGRYIGECKFVQEVSPSRQVNVTLFDDVICGPVSPREVAAFELSAPGVERWRISMPGSIGQVFKPTPNTLALADQGGMVRMIDPANGKTVMEARVPKCSYGVVDGALMDGVLYVYGYQEKPQEPNELNKQQWALAAVDAATGRVLWEQEKLGAFTFLNDELLRCSPNGIPVATFQPQTSRIAQPAAGGGFNPAPNGQVAGTIRLVVYDKKTGKPIGEPIETVLDKDPNATRIQDVQVWPGKILVVTGSSYLSYPLIPKARADAN